ncbi:UDP-phosphate galactose phosphotransferase [Gallibacterium genomosp. 3]|uniref:UDP-phosphate galactose phosphotransferase n=1 Tax=Gallibacterium genomosp. 3 TaxID=505345 RepID=A0A1A7PRD4_9PAST|nr:undecaprenyl-phosphate galactose phosphotransferase WbaP [Gallibacterium genomosp. 3]OBX04306.1 UDP-phosphate galactose phosphotransferase [Gallibacterium genomosp. 3]
MRILISMVILILVDFILFFVSFYFGIALNSFYMQKDINVFLPSSEYLEREIIHFILVFLCILWFGGGQLRHYSYRKPFWFELKEIIKIIFIFSIFELAIIAFSKLYFSRYLWITIWGITLFFVPLGRFFIKKLLINLKLYTKNTIIIGAKKNALDAYKALISEPYLGLVITQFISVDNSTIEDEIKNLDINIIRSKDVDKFLDLNNNIDTQFIIALEENEDVLRNFWLRKLTRKNYRFISIVPTVRGIPLYSTDVAFIFSYEIMLLRIHNNLSKISSRFLKRIIDIIGSLLLLILFSPLLITLYYLISREEGGRWGNVIYGHTRIGRNKKPFKCLKFRSMVLNSQEVLQQILANDPVARREWEKDFKLKNDPRITKVGHFLRKTSLDELPQLLNVLKGEMSLVGPRPIVRSELIKYKDNVDYYFMAKPGMTGLWQISGRNNVDYTTRVYYDVWYVKNWSIWNDIVILFKTVKIVLNRNGAY